MMDSKKKGSEELGKIKQEYSCGGDGA